MGTTIADTYIELDGQEYFRRNAHLINLGTYGDKHEPFLATGYLDPQSKVQSEYLASRVQRGTIVTVDWSQTNKAAVEVNGPLTFFRLNGKIDVTGTYEKVKSAHLRLANFYIIEGPLQRMLNTDADGARHYLAEEGHDGRIVSEVWVVMEQELAEHFSSNGSASFSVKAAGAELQLTVAGGTNGTQTITMSAGTTFAYKLHKVSDWNKDKTHIENMEVDVPGIG